MNKARELTYLLTDSGATALLCLEELYESVAKGVIETGDTQVRSVITASPLDWQTRNDPGCSPTPARPAMTARSTCSS